MGRPLKTLTEEQITQVEALGAVLSIEQIADYFGINKNTFYRMTDTDPVILTRYKKGKAKAIGTIANSLLTQARNGNLTAQMFYLKTQAGWRETNNLELATKGNEPLKIIMEPVKQITPQVIESDDIDKSDDD